MGEASQIEWTDATHNFWYGCRRVSPGCARCYADREMTRYGRDFNTVTRAKGFNKPLGWRKKGRAPGDGLLIFVNSWSDFFIDDSDPWRDEAWEVIRRTPQHTFQILTKRPERIAEHLPKMCLTCGEPWPCGKQGENVNWPWPNVWLGTSVENQRRADERIPKLVSVPAAVHFLSCEPLLGPIDFTQGQTDGVFGVAIHPLLVDIEWVITGGESDYKKPRLHYDIIDWFRSIRDQCLASGTAYFHKQLGGTKKCACHNAWGCRELDGRTWDEFPESQHAVDPVGKMGWQG